MNVHNSSDMTFLLHDHPIYKEKKNQDKENLAYLNGRLRVINLDKKH